MSMNQQWSDVWSSRGLTDSDPHLRAELALGDLLRIDGWDVGAGAIEESSFLAYAKHVGDRLGLREGSRVFEIGCGAGAFLMALRQHWPLLVSGSDFAPGLLSIASAVMPDGDFYLADATQPPPEAMVSSLLQSGDATILNGVLHYFPSIEDVASIIRWLAPLSTRVALLEIPDAATQQESENERAGKLPPGEYARRYAESGLTHLYIDRGALMKLAGDAGFTVELEDQQIGGYAQSRFRFNAYLSRCGPL
jgi:SAM-dependent methyltransferase